MWQLKECVRVFFKKDILYFFNEIEQQESYLLCNDKRIIKTMINNKKFNNSFELFKFLKKNNLIKKCFINKFEGSRFEKNIHFFSETLESPNEVQLSLNEKKVCIVGAGGVGNSILRQLIFLGIKKFVIFDYDKIEASNLNRQEYYKNKDKGLNKIDVLKSKINKDFEDIQIDVKNIKINHTSDLNFIPKDVDLIVCAIDNPFNYKQILLKVSIEKNKPIIFGGVGVGVGIYGPFLLDDYSKNKYMLSLKKIENSENIPKSSIIFTNELISTLMVRDIFFFLSDQLPISQNQIIKVDLLSLVNETPIKIEKEI